MEDSGGSPMFRCGMTGCYIYIHQAALQERIKILTKYTFCYKNFLKLKVYLKN
jgi:hypothetical protein